MQKKIHCNLTTTVDLAEDEGFEPPQTESESGVLPLHKSSICDPGPHGGDNRTRTCDLMRVKHAL